MKGLMLGLMVVAFLGSTPTKVKVADLVAKPNDWHEKPVIAEGKVKAYEARTSRRGNDYLVFDLLDGKKSVHVYGRYHLPKPPKEGQTVIVTGLFRKEKTVGERKIINEIEVTPKLNKAFGVKLK